MLDFKGEENKRKNLKTENKKKGKNIEHKLMHMWPLYV